MVVEENNKLNDSILQLSQKMQDELGVSMDTKADTIGSGSNSNSSSFKNQEHDEESSNPVKKTRMKRLKEAADNMKFNTVTTVDDDE